MPIELQPLSGIALPEPSGGVALVSGSRVVAILSAGGLSLTSAQGTILPTLIAAASREIIRFCGNRPFAQQAYREIVVPEGTRQDRGEPATAKLRRFPVLSITRCAVGRMTALTLRNTSTTNQEASVAFQVGGDVDFDNLTGTGLILSRTASGTVTTDTVTWTTGSPYTTIASVAASINALGGGWSATATTGGTPDASLLPAAYLVGVREPKAALSPARVALDVFATPFSDYSIERSTGILSCRGFPRGSGFAVADWEDGPCGFGWPPVEVCYQAGFATVPESVQLSCAEVVQLMLDRLGQDPSLKSETTGKYTWVARDVLGNLSEGAQATLALYKDWTV